jgi:hypothetical protein
MWKDYKEGTYLEEKDRFEKFLDKYFEPNTTTLSSYESSKMTVL